MRFHATGNRVRTRCPKETEVTNRETDSRVVFILFLDLLTRQMLGNHFLMKTTIISLIKQGLGSSKKLMLKDWNWRTPNTDLFESRREQNSPATGIIYEGKSVSRNSDTKFARFE